VDPGPARAGCRSIGYLMIEALRQLAFFQDGKLSMLPKDRLNRQVYASFQHDGTAVPALTAMITRTSCPGPTIRTWRAHFPTPRRYWPRSSMAQVAADPVLGIHTLVARRVSHPTGVRLPAHTHMAAGAPVRRQGESRVPARGNDRALPLSKDAGVRWR
jgi:hypothetical protein